MPAMMRRTGKRLAILSGIAAIAVLVGAACAFRHRAVEQWHLWKLDSSDANERTAAAESLGKMGSRRGYDRIFEPLLLLNLDAMKTLLDIDGSRERQAPPGYEERQAIEGLYIRFARSFGPQERIIDLYRASLKARAAGIRYRTIIAQHIGRDLATAPLEDKRLALATFIEALRSDDLLARAGGAFGIRMLGRDGAEAVPALTEALRDDRIRAHAQEALRKVREPERLAEVSPAYRAEQELGVLKAAFARALTDDPNPRSRIYYLSFRSDADEKAPWKDPPAELFPQLARILAAGSGPGRPVTVLPESRRQPDPAAQTEDSRPDPECHVAIREWISEWEVEVHVTIYGGPLSGSGFDAKVIKTEAGWQLSPGTIANRFIS